MVIRCRGTCWLVVGEVYQTDGPLLIPFIQAPWAGRGSVLTRWMSAGDGLSVYCGYHLAVSSEHSSQSGNSIRQRYGRLRHKQYKIRAPRTETAPTDMLPPSRCPTTDTANLPWSVFVGPSFKHCILLPIYRRIRSRCLVIVHHTRSARRF
jgi:hypothetical protein